MASALAQLDDALAAAGISRTGEPGDPRVRPWGTVVSAPTAVGTVWLKAPGPTTAFEVPLYEILNRVVPRHVLDPVAVDVERGWVLLPDGGPELGEALTGESLAAEMGAVLGQYAELQRSLAAHAPELLNAGVTDMRPAVMPRRFDEALRVARGYVERTGDDGGREALERLGAARQNFLGWCERLAALPGPPSLDHNDLHPWNVLAREPGSGRSVRFYDWGDSVLAHPFACMLVPLGFVRDSLDAGVDDPRFYEVRDAYLAVYADLASHEELVETLELACRIGKVARALVWHRALSARGPQDDEGRFASAPLESLVGLLDESYLGKT